MFDVDFRFRYNQINFLFKEGVDPSKNKAVIEDATKNQPKTFAEYLKKNFKSNSKRNHCSLLMVLCFIKITHMKSFKRFLCRS